MKKVVFIMASSHSGSTLLDLLLGSHSQAFSLGELANVGRQGDKRCGVCGAGCEFRNREKLAGLVEARFPVRNGLWTRLASLSGWLRCNPYETLFAESEASVLVDSSKNVWWIRRQLTPFWQWRQITPCLLYLYRDGRAVANSLLRKYPERSMESAARDWLLGTRARERYYHAFPESRRTRVTYQELTSEPETTVRSVCDWLSIEYEPAMLEYWKHDHHPVQGNYGTRWQILSYRAQQEGREPPKMSERRREHYERMARNAAPVMSDAER